MYGSRNSSYPTWLIIIVIGILLVGFIQSCSSQNRAREFGGDTELYLPPNQKLVNITWKESSLWYLMKPMADDDEAEVYTFQQSSALGFFSGSVTIYERKMSQEELEEWEKEQQRLWDEYNDPYYYEGDSIYEY